jgi:phosphatidylglycerol---prolipoprotein diacylglyceryl transferase
MVSKWIRNGVNSNLTPEQRLKNLAGLITGAIIGSKLPVILSYGFDFILLLSSKSIYGALIGAYLGINISKRISGIKGNFGDIYIPPLCIGVFFGKIGCYINGCCGNPNYPVQIWTSGFHLVLFFIFIFFHKHKYFTDRYFAIYMLLYSLYRFCEEFVRTEPRILFNLTIYQIMAIIIIPYFIYVLNKRGYRRKVNS